MFRCAVLDDYQDAAKRYGDWDRLAGRVELRIYNNHFETEDEVAAAIEDCHIALIMRERTQFRRSLFERLPNLKLLVTTGPRNAAIDLAAAAAHGIVVSGTGSFGGSTAELTWGLIIAFARSIPLEYGNFRARGPWQSTVGQNLFGRRLGVIGLGTLGQRVAQVGKAFGMQVQAWSQNLTRERCAAAGVDFAPSLDDLLVSSDVVTVHLVLSERTRGLIGARELARMKSDALLVNTSRGPIIDEASLIGALRERRIGGAALDVYDHEPLPTDHPFRSLDNVVATPHIGYVTEGNYRIYYGDSVADIVAWLEGSPIRVISATG